MKTGVKRRHEEKENADKEDEKKLSDTEVERIAEKLAEILEMKEERKKS